MPERFSLLMMRYRLVYAVVSFIFEPRFRNFYDASVGFLLVTL